MRKLFVYFILAMACTPKYSNPHVQIQTHEGEVELELYADKAPKTVAGFLRFIDSGYYRNSQFYRVLSDDNQPMNAEKIEIVQGGNWRRSEKINAGTIAHESTNETKILHTAGTISLARLGLGTASTEFFICMENAPTLDSGGSRAGDGMGYAAFGRVVKGMSVLRKIYRKRSRNQYFEPPVPIFTIRRVN